LPHDRHAALINLSSRQRAVVESLSALLRIADGLDRSHFSVIQDLEVKIGKSVSIVLHTSEDPELEIWAARNRVDLFEKVFQRPVQFETRPLEGEPS